MRTAPPLAWVAWVIWICECFVVAGAGRPPRHFGLALTQRATRAQYGRCIHAALQGFEGLR